MTSLISKLRAQKTRDRERAGQISPTHLPFPENPFIGFLITIMFWLLVSGIIHAGILIKPKEFSYEQFLHILGNSMFFLSTIFAMALYLSIAQPILLRRNSRIILITLLVLLPLALSKIAYRLFQASGILSPEVMVFTLPFPLAPLLGRILISPPAAITAGILFTIASSLLAGKSFTVILTGIIAVFAITFLSHGIKTRAKVLTVSLWTASSQLICVAAYAMIYLEKISIPIILYQAAGCFASALISAMIVLVFLPAFESIFAITTDIKLLELSDLGHPLLQRLAIEAPGTYHHSLLVASLAQAAADEIGANSLLARVSAYFHDIGKLVKPEFFAENIHLNNPHDDLPPSMSTLILSSHVKEGLSLAMIYKLPSPIVDVIREHHGTSLMSVFHHKAKEQMELTTGKNAPLIDQSAFRYPGPKPTSKESAIICLADAVEAASRSLEKPSPSHLENLVQDIIITRLEDGQLDQCELTLAELTKIKRIFIFALRNMYHKRMSYPKDENHDKQSPKSSEAPL